MPRRSSRRLSNKEAMEGENKQPAEVEEPVKDQEPEATENDATADAKTEEKDTPPEDTTDNATENTTETTNGTDEEEKKDEAGEKRIERAEKEIEIERPTKKMKVEGKNEDAQDGDADEVEGEEAKESPPLVKEKVTEDNGAEKTTLTAEA